MPPIPSSFKLGRALFLPTSSSYWGLLNYATAAAAAAFSFFSAAFFYFDFFDFALSVSLVPAADVASDFLEAFLVSSLIGGGGMDCITP